MRAWVSLKPVSIFCSTAMENVAVLPVPDWAWAITSIPYKRTVNQHCKESIIDYLDAGHNGSLLDSGGLLEPVGIDTSEEFLSQVHVVKVLANLR